MENYNHSNKQHISLQTAKRAQLYQYHHSVHQQMSVLKGSEKTDSGVKDWVCICVCISGNSKITISLSATFWKQTVFLSSVFFYMSYFLFPWKKAVPEQKKFQKAHRCLLCSEASKRKTCRYEKKKKSPAVAWILIKEAIHIDRTQSYCCFKSTDFVLKKKCFMLSSNKFTSTQVRWCKILEESIRHSFCFILGEYRWYT